MYFPPCWSCWTAIQLFGKVEGNVSSSFSPGVRTREATLVLRVEPKHIRVVWLKPQPTPSPTMPPQALLSNGPFCGAAGGFMQLFISLCAQWHSAVTVTVRPVILCALKWELSPNERMSEQFMIVRWPQSLDTIKFLLELRAPHGYWCPCTRSTPGQEVIFWERRVSGDRGFRRLFCTYGEIMRVWTIWGPLAGIANKPLACSPAL